MKPTLNTFAPPLNKKVNESFSLPSPGKGKHIIVVGAGAFGGWTALYLLRKGFKVTLIDAWGAGNSRSSSGDETRVIRSTYGANEIYFDMNVQALATWKEHERQFSKNIFFNTGVLWMCYHEHTAVTDDSIPFAEKHNMPYEYLSGPDMDKRFPLVNTSDLHHAWLDPFGGYLKAREACLAVQELFCREGGTYVQGLATPGNVRGEKMESIILSDGKHHTADLYVFACGAWLGKLFPESLANLITCTRQEVFYFGAPADHARAFDQLPVWVDADGNDNYYGIPGNTNRGFKIGVDIRGANFDPTNGERVSERAVLDKARAFVAHRFPLLAHAPLVESRVCPYENSPDGNFIIDMLPDVGNVVVVGGGSGHGFKHGPAVGELVATALEGNKKIPGLFSLQRF